MSREDEPSDPLLRPGVAARLLGVTTETLRQWIAKGALSYVEVGPSRRKRIRQSQVDRLMVDSDSSFHVEP